MVNTSRKQLIDRQNYSSETIVLLQVTVVVIVCQFPQKAGINNAFFLFQN